MSQGACAIITQLTPCICSPDVSTYDDVLYRFWEWLLFPFTDKGSRHLKWLGDFSQVEQAAE